MKILRNGRESQDWKNMKQIFQFIFDTIFCPFNLIISLCPRATVVTHHA